MKIRKRENYKGIQLVLADILLTYFLRKGELLCNMLEAETDESNYCKDRFRLGYFSDIIKDVGHF